MPMQRLEPRAGETGEPGSGCRILPWRGSEPCYGQVVDAVVARLRPRISQAMAEQRGAPRLVAELLPLPQPRRELLLRNSERFRSYFLSSLLLDVSDGLAEGEPRKAEDLARLALLILDRLDPDWYGASNLADARSRAWRRIANARRAASDYAGAEAAFARAELHLRDGSCDPLERAQLLSVKAALRRAQRRFVEADSLSRRAERLLARA
jgi:hypothetical protein